MRWHRKEGKAHARPATIAGKAQEVRKLVTKGLSKSAIAKQLNIGRTWPVPNSPVTSRRLRRGTVSDWQMEGRFCPNCPLQ